MEKWNNTGENYRLHIRISIWGFFGNIGSHHLWKSADNWQDWNGRSPHLAKKLRPTICVKKVGALIWWCGTHMGWWCLRHLWTYVWNRFSCACRVLIGYQTRFSTTFSSGWPEFWCFRGLSKSNKVKHPWFHLYTLLWLSHDVYHISNASSCGEVGRWLQNAFRRGFGDEVIMMTSSSHHPGWFWNPAKPGESLKAWLGNSAHGGPT